MSSLVLPNHVVVIGSIVKPPFSANHVDALLEFPIAFDKQHTNGMFGGRRQPIKPRTSTPPLRKKVKPAPFVPAIPVLERTDIALLPSDIATIERTDIAPTTHYYLPTSHRHRSDIAPIKRTVDIRHRTITNL